MKLSCIVIFAILVFSSCQNRHEKAILEVLDKQAAAWNAGDIEGYMQGYWKNDSLLFIGKNGPTYGYDATLARYKNSYSDTVKMGKLAFSDLRFKRLSKKHYFVSGRWALKRTIGDVSGSFTLIFKRIRLHWLIIADHSS